MRNEIEWRDEVIARKNEVIVELSRRLLGILTPGLVQEIMNRPDVLSERMEAMVEAKIKKAVTFLIIAVVTLVMGWYYGHGFCD